MPDFEVAVGAGTLRSDAADAVAFSHRWTPEGVTVESAFTGGHLLHVAVAGCVLNDTYREAERLGVPLAGVRVTASGDLERGTWRSTGIAYAIELDTTATDAERDALLNAVEETAEIPRTIAQGAPFELLR